MGGGGGGGRSMSVCVFVYACNKECCTTGMVNKNWNHAGPKHCKQC